MPSNQKSYIWQGLFAIFFAGSLAFYGVSMREIWDKYEVRSEPSQNLQWASLLLLVLTTIGMLSIHMKAMYKDRSGRKKSFRLGVLILAIPLLLTHIALGFTVGAHTGEYPDKFWFEKDLFLVATIIPFIVAGVYLLLAVLTFSGYLKNDWFDLEFWKGTESAQTYISQVPQEEQ